MLGKIEQYGLDPKLLRMHSLRAGSATATPLLCGVWCVCVVCVWWCVRVCVCVCVVCVVCGVVCVCGVCGVCVWCVCVCVWCV